MFHRTLLDFRILRQAFLKKSSCTSQKCAALSPSASVRFLIWRFISERDKAADLFVSKKDGNPQKPLKGSLVFGRECCLPPKINTNKNHFLFPAVLVVVIPPPLFLTPLFSSALLLFGFQCFAAFLLLLLYGSPHDKSCYDI